jgi:hypothetical protein
VTWTFSDGTEVDLGVKVRGSSAFANALRADLKIGVDVRVGPVPAEITELDQDDEQQVARWLTDMARIHRVRISSGPEPEPAKSSPSITGAERVY